MKTTKAVTEEGWMNVTSLVLIFTKFHKLSFLWPLSNGHCPCTDRVTDIRKGRN
jgi:hypothetical protein